MTRPIPGKWISELRKQTRGEKEWWNRKCIEVRNWNDKIPSARSDKRERRASKSHYYNILSLSLSHRCVDVGKFRLDGTHTRSCIFGEWTGEKPTCFGLNQENDYASKKSLKVYHLWLSTKNIRIHLRIPVEKPPTILFRHVDGPIAQSNDGKLIVYPGTTLHMECLWMRRFGLPKWNVSQTFRWGYEWVNLAKKLIKSKIYYTLGLIPKDGPRTKEETQLWNTDSPLLMQWKMIQESTPASPQLVTSIQSMSWLR